MSRKATKFYPCTISIYPNLLFFTRVPTGQRPINTIEEEFINKKDFFVRLNEKDYHIVFRNLKIVAGNLVGGKIGLEKPKSIDRDAGDVLRRTQIEDYPNIAFFWNREEQTIYLQTSFQHKFGLDINTFMALLERVCELILGEVYSVNVKCLPAEGEFKKVIASSKKLYLIEFELLSPNIGGKTEREIVDFLRHLKAEHNITSYSESLNNKDGNLKVEDADTFDPQVKTIENVGGQWKIKNDVGTFKSTDKNRLVDREFLSAQFGEAVLEDVLRDLDDENETEE